MAAASLRSRSLPIRRDNARGLGFGRAGMPVDSHVSWGSSHFHGTPFELSLTADASRVRFVNSALDGGMFGSQGGPCDPFAKNDARGTRAS